MLVASELVKTQIAGGQTSISDFNFWDRAQQFAFLKNVQVLLIMLAQGACFEKHCLNFILLVPRL